MPSAFPDPAGQPPLTATGPRRTVLVVLGVLGVLTIVGLVLLWPNYTSVHKASSNAHYAAQGTTFVNASVEAIQDSCPGFTAPTAPTATGPGDSRACQLAKVKVLAGSSKGIQITLPVLWPYSKGDLRVGDQVQLMQSHTGSAEAGQSDAQNGTIGAGNGSSFTVAGIVRNQPILWWVVAFVVVVAAVGALRGILSLVALAFAGATVVFFTLPALISGSSGLAVGVVSA
ncbi:MAG: hypothetical protein ACTHON_13225, partial [Humibacter sp.]